MEVAVLNGWGGWRNQKKKKYFMTHENYIKFKFHWLSIHLLEDSNAHDELVFCGYFWETHVELRSPWCSQA